MRELQSQAQDLREDLEAEREGRRRAEKEKKDLMEEVESLRNEITNQTDTSSVIQEQFKKQNDEVGLFVCLGWEMDGRVFFGVF